LDRFDRPKRKSNTNADESDGNKKQKNNAGAGRPANKEVDAAAKAKELLLNKLMGNRQRLS